MNDDTSIAIEKAFNPEVLRSNLITVSVYITAFELLKECVLERPKEMYTSGFDSNGFIVDQEKYKNEVLSLNKSPLYASLKWLIKHGALAEDDENIFTEVKNMRNKLAHELPEFIYNPKCEDPTANFLFLSKLVDKIEKWWIFNVDIPTNPDFDGQEVDIEQINPGRSITLQLLTEIALGNDGESSKYYELIK
ncbi:MAG: hypothetical protein J7L46_03885 [Bacteroidales bacterium]|nr:hypothetical protein [Bacteroidales bacterium]